MHTPLDKLKLPKPEEITLSDDIFDVRKTCWQRLEDYLWLNNHQFFYICCIHEYGGPAWLRGSPKFLLVLRMALFLTMVGLVIGNWTDDIGEHIQFTLFNVYLTTLVTLLQVFTILQYNSNLRKFKLKVIQSKDLAVSKLMKLSE